MYQAGTNRPEGKGYSQEFGAWLTKNKLDDMDKSDRSKLFTVMDNLPAIEGWRATLTITERMRLNHPTTVLRNWQRATQVPNAQPRTPTRLDVLRQENVRLRAHIDGLGTPAAPGARTDTRTPAAPGNCFFCDQSLDGFASVTSDRTGAVICIGCLAYCFEELRQANAIRWHETDSQLRGHSVYYDDPRGPDHSRFQIVPVATRAGRFARYSVRDEEGSEIGEARTVEEAKAIAQQQADRESDAVLDPLPPSWSRPQTPNQ
jgi:hypothetical protein